MSESLPRRVPLEESSEPRAEVPSILCACLEVRVALGAQPGFEWGVCSRACAGGAGAHGQGFVLREVPNFCELCY